VRRNARDAGERQVLYGVHPVLEALESGKRTVERILVAREGGGAGLGRLLRRAREEGVPVSHVPRGLLARTAGVGAVHQGVLALVSAVSYADPDDLCRGAAAGKGILVVLEGVTDPRNLGAARRSAAGAGAAGVLLAGTATVGLTPLAAKASAGAVERIPVAREPRIGRRIGALKQAGFRVAALDPAGPLAWDEADLTGPLVLLAGAEGAGLRPALLQAADLRLSIPLACGLDSLNVSVALGVVLFEAVRQRRRGPGRPLGSFVPGT